MSFFSDLQAQLDSLRALVGNDVDAADLPSAVSRLTDESVVAVVAGVSILDRGCEALRIAAAGVVAARSTRDAGHDGLAQTRGHRSPVSLIQDLTGSTRADAAKQVRLGEALTGSHGPADVSGVDDGSAPVDATPPWHAPLGDALLAGTITSAQHDVILRGLGEPPAGDPSDPASVAEAAQVWSLAAEQLILEASERTVEELARAARTVRDVLDPEGAERRFDERFQRRSFRMWTDADGIRRASLAFEDEGAAWVQAIIDAALRPRRGGPRFVDPAEKARAEELAADPRSNEQLAYDLIVDTLRAGSLADAETVFGTRQAGIRVVITQDAAVLAASGEPTTAVLEDDGTAVPGWLALQRGCDTGGTECTFDREGNPLYLGREARLFSSRQRVTLAIRDGGCRWRRCDRPAHYCEAHHIDEYAEGGCTDVDRGILLCRFHHMQLHHGGWRITRDGLGDFVLHPPAGQGDPVVLEPRVARRYLWGDIDPPPKRFRPAA